MTGNKDATAWLGEIGGIIRRARAEINSSEPVDLQGLEGTMNALCAAVAELPREQAEVLRPKLVSLKDDLDTLEAKVREAHVELSRELKGVSIRSQALNAYNHSRGSK